MLWSIEISLVSFDDLQRNLASNGRYLVIYLVSIDDSISSSFLRQVCLDCKLQISQYKRLLDEYVKILQKDKEFRTIEKKKQNSPRGKIKLINFQQTILMKLMIHFHLSSHGESYSREIASKFLNYTEESSLIWQKAVFSRIVIEINKKYTCSQRKGRIVISLYHSYTQFRVSFQNGFFH